jgi:hypothetical protein
MQGGSTQADTATPPPGRLDAAVGAAWVPVAAHPLQRRRSRAPFGMHGCGGPRASAGPRRAPCRFTLVPRQAACCVRRGWTRPPGVLAGPKLAPQHAAGAPMPAVRVHRPVLEPVRPACGAVGWAGSRGGQRELLLQTLLPQQSPTFSCVIAGGPLCGLYACALRSSESSGRSTAQVGPRVGLRAMCFSLALKRRGVDEVVGRHPIEDRDSSSQPWRPGALSTCLARSRLG